MKISIITPTKGNPLIVDCINSVRAQTYKNIEHIIIVDGKEKFEELDKILKASEFPNGSNEYLCVFPYQTSNSGHKWNRIYGAATYMADGEYHIWLDDENLLEPNHVESLLKLAVENNLHWVYSLRKFVDEGGNFVAEDNCESLGLWSSILSDDDYFVDLNCFMVHKILAVELSPVWYRKFKEVDQPEINRIISKTLMSKENNLKFDCTRLHTVKYRTRSDSIQKEYYEQGNKVMLDRHNGKFPWK